MAFSFGSWLVAWCQLDDADHDHGHREVVANGGVRSGRVVSRVRIKLPATAAMYFPGGAVSYSISHGPGGGSSGSDSSPGLRTLIIPRLAARGMALPEIASITGVPLALVELITGRPPASPEPPEAIPTLSVPVDGPVDGPGRLNQKKFLVWLATFIFLAGATLVSVLLHVPLLPLAVMVAGGWLGYRTPTVPR